MAQRSTGVFPREKFDLDSALEVTATSTAASISLKSLSVIRVVVLGAVYTAPTGDGDAGNITVNVGGKAIVFRPGDFDVNGVGIAHVRGSLCDANNNIDYDLNAGANNTGTGGSYVVGGVYIDAVDNVG